MTNAAKPNICCTRCGEPVTEWDVLDCSCLRDKPKFVQFAESGATEFPIYDTVEIDPAGDEDEHQHDSFCEDVGYCSEPA